MQPERTAPRALGRPHVIERSYYRGIIHPLMSFPVGVSLGEIEQAFSQDRLLVSRDGMRACFVHTGSDGWDHLIHACNDLPPVRFAKHTGTQAILTRLLEVGPDHVLVWGRPEGKETVGIYSLSCEEATVELVHAFPSVYEVRRMSHGILLVGTDQTETVQRSIWTQYGVLDLADTFSAQSLPDGSFLFLETLSGEPYRYRISANGFLDFSHVHCLPDETATALVRVQNQYVLATSSQHASRLRVIGSVNRLSFPLQEAWEGEIEHLWVSPNEQSLAWLVRPDRSKTHRRLYLNGALIHHGDFLMTTSDLVWSRSGTTFAARATSLEETGIEKRFIVTPKELLFISKSGYASEFLVDDEGHVVSTILEQGTNIETRMEDRFLGSPPMAWNMHWMPEGGVAFNFVQAHGSETKQFNLYRMSDETDVLRH